MDNNNRTDKEILAKGLKQLGLCLFLMFAGPTLLHVAFSNDDKPLYIPLLVLAIVFCIAAIVMLFLGINTILNSIFKKN